MLTPISGLSDFLLFHTKHLKVGEQNYKTVFIALLREGPL